jgi:hypothetical protein
LIETRLLISVDIELCIERQVGVRHIVVLMAFNMNKSWENCELAKTVNDFIGKISIRLECAIGEWIQERQAGLNAGN